MTREHFWMRVEHHDGNECWPWLGVIDRDGYARFGSRIASRMAYEFEVGPIPAGLTIDHLCFNRRCVNPLHLEPVTRSENLRRQQSASKTECKNGHPFDDANTYRRPASGGRQRNCRACNRAAVKRYAERKVA